MTRLVIACGALVREMQMLIAQTDADIALTCLPAQLHNRPDRIAPQLEEKIIAAQPHYEEIFVAYGDCGSYGAIDEVIERYGVARMPGAHCYAFFLGLEEFDAITAANPFQFFLTDFMVRHFKGFIMRGLGLDRHPELLPLYFGNYRDLVYMSQIEDAELLVEAKRIAEYLGLTFHHRHTAFGLLEQVTQGAT